MDDYFEAGVIAKALGLKPELLRLWRKRKICLMGFGEAPLRRRYSFQDACCMAFALALVRRGWELSAAFEYASWNRTVCDLADTIAKDGSAESYYFLRAKKISYPFSDNGKRDQYKIMRSQEFRDALQNINDQGDFSTGEITVSTIAITPLLLNLKHVLSESLDGAAS